MQRFTYDRSATLDIALTASGDLREPTYVPLDAAPTTMRRVAPPYLRQLHTVANGVVSGLTATQRTPHAPEQWESSW